ncbi:ABC transporter substrate-binding protein [Xanthobacter sp. DSM 24535]|uniref:ABC transporter substrate-binding protein n=1 Tax=Roseixanthobacter psychrophilus TaxID=3119917 RepID=UPI00372B7B64
MRIATVWTALGLVASGLAPVSAQTVKVGVIVSTTGPAASLGIPEKNTFQLAPAADGTVKLEFVYLDDASDPTAARRAAEQMVNEDKVDVILGPSITATSLAIVEVAARSGTPMVSLASAARIIEPMDDQRRWIFKIPYSDFQLARTMLTHMVAKGIKTVGFIGFNDAYGESWFAEFSREAEARGLKIVTNERYAPRDTSVTAQVLKTIAARPDAVLIAASGTPAVLPQSTLVERGYRGPIYQTAGVINRDFLRVGGKSVEGTLLPGGPLIVSDQLPETHPSRQQADAYRKAYEGTYGPGSLTTFGANAWDASLLVLDAARRALAKAATPGSPAFRAALRDAIESTDGLHTSLGVIRMSPTKHLAFDDDAPVMIRIRNSGWQLLK